MNATPSWITETHKNAGWLVALGVIEIIVGVLAIFSPLAGGLAVTMFLGAALMVGGLARLFAAFGADSFGSGALASLWGLLVAVSGFYIFANPGLGLATLTLVVAMMFFASGLTQIFVSLKMRPASGWGWTLTGGIVTVLLAFMVWRQFPFSGLWLVGTMVGIHLIFAGMSTVTVGSAARKLTATS